MTSVTSESVRLWDFLLAEFPALWPSKRQAKRACELGRVNVNGEVNHSAALLLEEGDTVELLILEEVGPPVAASKDELSKIGVQFLHRDDDKNELVVLKPAGLKLRGDITAIGEFAKEIGRHATLESIVQRAVQLPVVVAPGYALPKAAAGLVRMCLRHDTRTSILMSYTAPPPIYISHSLQDEEDKECHAKQECVTAGDIGENSGGGWDYEDCKKCPWCEGGVCITTLAVLCGKCPKVAWVPMPESLEAAAAAAAAVEAVEAVEAAEEGEGARDHRQELEGWQKQGTRYGQHQHASPDSLSEAMRPMKSSSSNPIGTGKNRINNQNIQLLLLRRMSTTPSNRHGCLSTGEQLCGLHGSIWCTGIIIICLTLSS